MRHFTPQQRAFIREYTRTGNGRQAAISAGYAKKDAASRASKLLANEAIRREVERLIALSKSRPIVDASGQPGDQHTDPLEYMRQVMRDADEDPRLRLEAAKALASFTIAKPGSQGKKEQQKDAARKAGEGRFGLRTQQPAPVVPIR